MLTQVSGPAVGSSEAGLSRPEGRAVNKSSLRRKTIRATRWSLVSQWVRQILTLLVTALLARILVPEDYGLIGMALVVTNLANLFRDLGTSSAVIQREEVSETLLSTLLWTNLAVGCSLAGLVALVAVPAAYYFRDPRLTWILWALAPSFILAGGSTVQQALLQRDLRFARLARVEILSCAFGASVACAAALSGLSLWSLVAQTLSYNAVSAVLLWRLNGWRPRAQFSFLELKSVWNYSLNLTGFSTVNYLIRNADSLLIGRMLGSQSLGFYSMASKIILYPLQTISGMVGRTLFPALARAQNDEATFRRGYFGAVGFIAMVTFPLMAGLMAIAKPAVTTFLSPKWSPVVPLLLILCPLGLIQSVLTTSGVIFQAKGRTDLMFRIGACSSAATVVAFVVGLHWGLLGLCGAYLLIELLNTPFTLCFAFRQLSLPVRAIFAPIKGPLICSAIMALLVHWSLTPVVGFCGPRAGAGLLILEGAVLYLASNWVLNRDQARELRNLLVGRL